MKLCFGTAAQERVQCKKSKPGRCFFVTQHSLSKQQKGRRGQKKIKRKKNPFPSPTHTQTTVPNRGAIQGCSETGHKEKCFQIKPTPFFFFLNFCLGVFFFFLINIMEAPGRCWGSLRVEVLLIPSAPHWHSSHAGPDVQPLSGVLDPLSRLLRV